jgi:RNA polymerase sigma-70 factor (ECF subfamily)
MEDSTPAGGARLEEFAELLQKARGGSQDALGRLVEAYRPLLLAIANEEMDPALRGRGGASDLVQDALLQAGLKFDTFRGESEDSLRAWRKRILHNKRVNWEQQERAEKRDARREVALGSGTSGAHPGQSFRAPGPSPSSEVSRREQQRLLETALQRLCDDYQQVIELQGQKGNKWEEIGQALGRSGDAARKLWGRAIRELGEKLGGSDEP